MKITVWVTEHRINRIVTEAAISGLKRLNQAFTIRSTSEYNGVPVPSLSYGVLRGPGRIYQDCERAGIPWWNIDKGFFRPGHFSGYYRIGYRHLMPLYQEGKREDVSRWKRFRINMLPWVHRPDGTILICPPEGICDHYGISQVEWIDETIEALPKEFQSKVVVRMRTSHTPLAEDLSRARCVVTHSSNVALEALVLGIPAIAETGIVKSWNGLSFNQVGELPNLELSRKDLFVQAANSQFTLAEFRSGLAWTSTLKRCSFDLSHFQTAVDTEIAI